MPSRIGALAGRYILTRLLGEDAAGAIFEGLDKAQDRPVLVKLLPKTLAADPSRQEQLQRLVERLTELDHPNLLSVLEVGIEEGTPYLIAQAIAATPLAQKMGQALDVEQVASIMSQAGEALIHAYRQGLTHGRLSPQNVLLTASGQVLLSDVGLESVLETPWEKVQSELTGYLAPERLKGWLPDARADVYALGVMLVEMLTGLRPNGSAEKALSWLHAAVPGLAPALEPVLVRALTTDPKARYATVGEFMADLRPILDRYLQSKEVRQLSEPVQPAVLAPVEAPEPSSVPPSHPHRPCVGRDPGHSHARAASHAYLRLGRI
jgi:serine/threonine-protein kinase